MAKRVNTSIIGFFVLTAIGLLLVSIIIFSGGSYFKKTNRYILFFQETVSGLNVGAPVKFRGVEIGSVKSVVLLADPESRTVDIPIVIEIDPEKFISRGEKIDSVSRDLGPSIDAGLRARLDLQSIVTGQLYIQIDYLPNTPVKLVGIDDTYPEIPTIKSSFTELRETLDDMPVKQVVVNIEKITRLIKEALEKESLQNLLSKLGTVLDDVDTLVLNADQMVTGLEEESAVISDEVSKVLVNASDTLDSIAKSVADIADSTDILLSNVNDEVDPLAEEVKQTLQAAQKTLADASTTLASADNFINESDVRFKLAKTLDEIGAAARSIRDLADYLERHPEALFQGKFKR